MRLTVDSLKTQICSPITAYVFLIDACALGVP
jgi:hypothetical protein